ncbi:unnamed protein product [Pleuronectes platessa]|uniref:Uncharacterized protein n=1 Tax=Pleuronectes platessa TaxID=8262 RepID=A0A9N7UMV4_PLEPL|nr:unnamed protein product [Pleuronectes platessa]
METDTASSHRSNDSADDTGLCLGWKHDTSATVTIWHDSEQQAPSHSLLLIAPPSQPACSHTALPAERAALVNASDAAIMTAVLIQLDGKEHMDTLSKMWGNGLRAPASRTRDPLLRLPTSADSELPLSTRGADMNAGGDYPKGADVPEEQAADFLLHRAECAPGNGRFPDIRRLKIHTAH